MWASLARIVGTICVLASVIGCASNVRTRVGTVAHPCGGAICLWSDGGESIRRALTVADVVDAPQVVVSDVIRERWSELAKEKRVSLNVSSVDCNDAGTRAIASAAATVEMGRSIVAFWFVCVLEHESGNFVCRAVVVDDKPIRSPRLEHDGRLYTWVSDGCRVLVWDLQGPARALTIPRGSVFDHRSASIDSVKLLPCEGRSIRVGGLLSPETTLDGPRLAIEETWRVNDDAIVPMDVRTYDVSLDREDERPRDASLYVTRAIDESRLVPFGFSDDGQFAFYYRTRGGFFATADLVACEQATKEETVLERLHWAFYRE